jgi:hypothetical protein
MAEEGHSMTTTTHDPPASATDRAFRLTGVAGLISIPLGIAGVLIDRMWTFPGTGATGRQIAAFVAAHRPALLVAMILSTITVGLWLVFGVGVWRWMHNTDRGESVLATCFLAGLVSFITLLLAGFTAFFVVVYRAPQPSDPRLLYDLAFGLLAMSGVPTALALGAYALHAHGNRLPRSTAELAVVAAVAHLLLLGSLVIRSGFFSLAGGVTIAIPATLFAWILVTAAALQTSARVGSGAAEY